MLPWFLLDSIFTIKALSHFALSMSGNNPLFETGLHIKTPGYKTPGCKNPCL